VQTIDILIGLAMRRGASLEFWRRVAGVDGEAWRRMVAAPGCAPLNPN